MQVGCGNRPDYQEKRKIVDDEDDESLSESATTDHAHSRGALCRACKSKDSIENAPEEIITNNEYNIDRNPRFVNGKVRSYGIIYTMYNWGVVVDFLEINLSEQVYVTLLHWTNMLRKIDDSYLLPKTFIYDNACSVWIYFKKRLHDTRTIMPTTVASFLDWRG